MCLRACVCPRGKSVLSRDTVNIPGGKVCFIVYKLNSVYVFGFVSFSNYVRNHFSGSGYQVRQPYFGFRGFIGCRPGQ